MDISVSVCVWEVRSTSLSNRIYWFSCTSIDRTQLTDAVLLLLLYASVGSLVHLLILYGSPTESDIWFCEHQFLHQFNPIQMAKCANGKLLLMPSMPLIYFMHCPLSIDSQSTSPFLFRIRFHFITHINSLYFTISRVYLFVAISIVGKETTVSATTTAWR